MRVRIVILAIFAMAAVAFAQNPVTADSPFQVGYAANLNVGESYINLTNTGTNGASLYGPGFGPVGNICVNVYVFSPDEQMISCCSCLITPNGLVNLGVNRDLTANPLTAIIPNSVVIKLLATGAGAAFTGTNCSASAAVSGTAAFPIVAGLAAWGTTLHNSPPAVPAYSISSVLFKPATLSAGELASLNNRCTNIIGNGSGFGICRGCRLGGLGAGRQN